SPYTTLFRSRGGLLGERPLIGGALDQHRELVGAAGGAELLLRLDAEGTHHGVGVAVEQADRQAEELREQPLDAAPQLGRAQRPRDRHVLGYELAADRR